MTWPRWLTTLTLGPRPTPQRRPTVAEAAVDGEKMAMQAALMALKNRILVQAITTSDDIRAETLIPLAREVLQELVDEGESDQSRLTRNMTLAKKRPGLADSGTDYRRGDLANLSLRLRAGKIVTERLVALMADESQLTNFVEHAHRLAWDEISQEMQRSLTRRAATDAEKKKYSKSRDKRIHELIATDIAHLVERHEN